MNSLIGNLVGRLGIGKAKPLTELFENSKSISTSYALSHLIRANMPSKDSRTFAYHTPAQNFSTLEFRTFLEKSPKYIINFFLKDNKIKNDILDFGKVAAILHVQGLQFLDKNNELVTINSTLERAREIICSDAILEPKALHGLMFNKELALTALANRSYLIGEHNFLVEEISVLANVSANDVKGYCYNPSDFKNGRKAFSKIDCIYMDAVKRAA